nr:hypothetical protein [Luteitalea sp. TBR-22]
MVVDLPQRELLAQPVALPLVAGAVDGLREQERIVKPIELLLDGLHPPVLLRRSVLRLRPPLLPHVENPVCDQAHVAGGRLQEREFVREGALECSLADVDGPALALAVVVRVVAVPALRPAAGQRSSTGLATHEAAQREVRMVALPWAGHDDPAIEHRLGAVERGLLHERFEVAASGYAVVRALDLTGVDRVPHHLAEALRRDPEPLPTAKPGLGRAGDHFLLRVLPSRQFLERPADERTAVWIVNQARCRPLRRVQVSERRRECPAPELQRRTHAGASAF